MLSGYIKSDLQLGIIAPIRKDIAKNNALTFTNVGDTTDHNGRAGRGFSLVAGSKIVIPNTILRNKTKFTIIAGFYNANNTNYDILLKDTPPNRVGMLVAANVIYYLIGDGNNSYYHNITANANVHIAMVFDGSGSTNADKIKAYRNATNITNGAFNGTIPSVTNNRDTELAVRESIQMLDYLFIYDRALSQSEITKNYNYYRSH